MNWDQVEGQWLQAKGHVKSQWSKLTDDDLQNVAGKKMVLIGKLQARYGVLKDDAEKQVDEWLSKLSLGASKIKSSIEKGAKSS